MTGEYRASAKDFNNNVSVLEQIEFIKDHIGGAIVSEITTKEDPLTGKVTITFVMSNKEEFKSTFTTTAVTNITSRQEEEDFYITFHLANGQTYDVHTTITPTATCQWSALKGEPEENTKLTAWMNTKADASALVPLATKTYVDTETARAVAKEEELEEDIDATNTRIDTIRDTLMNILYPLGSIFVTTVDVNPATYIADTQWVKVGSGRTLIGASGSHPLGSEGGSETITLSEAQMPRHRHTQQAHGHSVNCAEDGSHNHSISMSNSGKGAVDVASGSVVKHDGSENTTSRGQHTHNITIGQATPTINETGSGEPHDNMMPYLTVIFFKRIA